MDAILELYRLQIRWFKINCKKLYIFVFIQEKMMLWLPIQ